MRDVHAMSNNVTASRPKETAILWFLKIITGLLVIFLLFIHFVVNHYLAPSGLLTYADVVQYYRNPIVPIMEGVFLAVVVSHSLIGLRGIILDLHPSHTLIRAIDWLFILVGIAAVVYGLWLIQAIVTHG